MRLPTPSSIPGFDLPHIDLDTSPIPLRCFRFPAAAERPERAILCIPGMAASGLSFARLRPLASRYDFHLLSGPVDSYPGGSRRPFADAVASLLDRFDRPVLLGTSFGSMVAIDVAARHQSLLRGLVLPTAFARNHAFPPFLRPVEKLLPRLQWLAKAVAPLSSRIVGGLRLDADAAEELAREAAEMSAKERRRRLEEVFESDLRGLLPTIDLPSLVIHGERDRLVSKRDSLELAALLPRSDYRQISDAAHVPYVSHPDEFNLLIDEFLEKVFSQEPLR